MKSFTLPVSERPHIHAVSTAGSQRRNLFYRSSAPPLPPSSVSRKSSWRRNYPCRMSPSFVVGVFIVLVATVHSQCVVPCGFKFSGQAAKGWLEQLKLARDRALAQQLASEMSAVDTQSEMCVCFWAETPHISSARCTCPLEDCHEYILGKNSGTHVRLSCACTPKAISRSENTSELVMSWY